MKYSLMWRCRSLISALCRLRNRRCGCLTMMTCCWITCISRRLTRDLLRSRWLWRAVIGIVLNRCRSCRMTCLCCALRCRTCTLIFLCLTRKLLLLGRRVTRRSLVRLRLLFLTCAMNFADCRSAPTLWSAMMSTLRFTLRWTPFVRLFGSWRILRIRC